ncbi:DUF1800 domain-containing protein [Noviherbaspirillum galbum]|uniref:DUF1800 domain-containing protein n=1 Tax=Noviherbaspirillum galbum TaxID=2709383 RepID=A0A6B3SN44_9BURK|nr:DUF1800 domain-containing protein [Noviherbaspirillum galbum]NEX62183.1 DUF1800 domain-containing protein [Noviherbaspirillum galbum]
MSTCEPVTKAALDQEEGGIAATDRARRDIGRAALVSAGASLALSACGGGGSSTGESSGSPTPASNAANAANGPAAAGGSASQAITAAAASRFLSQASMGATRDEVARVQSLGFAGWLDAQFAMSPGTGHWDWMVSQGYDASTNKNTEAGFDASAWRMLVSAPDTLRQRVALALSEITVAAIDGFVGAGWRAFSAAAYFDILLANAFGNYRTLLQQISTSAPMGEYLTFRGNVKYNATTGAMPDENYAREVMQLFSIGLLQLNPDGTPKMVSGKAQETYTLDDITGLARVFTGWDYNLAGGDTSTPDFKRRAMIQIPSRHETGEKTFLGTTIPAGTDGATSLKLALDWIFAHPNVAPFISRQLIQRLVCSNPSPAYVSRVSSVFNDDGNGVKGNMKAVIKAILLDAEARGDAGLADASFGKQREPILRFTAWARAFNANSPSNAWAVGNASDPATRLGQSPLRSPSVFNFFRPGYVPPNSAVGNAGLVAPEFQLTNESTVVGYINFMQSAVSKGIGDLKADYSSLLPLADNAQGLVDELNTVLAAGQLSAATVSMIRSAVDSITGTTDAARANRIYAAIVLVLAAPEFIIQK